MLIAQSMWVFWWCLEKVNIVQFIHMTTLSPYITDFCAIFLSTYMSSARQAMKATNNVAFTTCTAQVFPLEHGTHWRTVWTENWELSSCQYAMHMHTYYFFFAQDHERQQTKKWVGGVKIASEIKRIRQMENKIGKHESIFNAEILMCSSSYVCGCVRFDANG